MGLSLIGTVSLDGSGWDRGLSRMASSMKSFIAGAFGFYGVQAAIRKTVDTASELIDASKSLGVAPEQLQILQKAAEDAGSDLDALATAFEKIDVARAKALGGDKTALKAFAAIGVSPDDLKTKTAARIFQEDMGRIAKTMSQETAGPILGQILGAKGGKLIATLKTDFDALGAQMRNLGAITDTETAVALHQLRDNFALLSKIMVSRFGPALISLAEMLYKAVGGLAAGWAYAKTYAVQTFDSDRARSMQDVMAATPGYGGVSPGQKAALDRLKRAASVDKAAADLLGMSLDDYREKRLKDKHESARKAAGAEALKVVDAFLKPLEKMKKDLEKKAKALKNPKPLVVEPPEETPERKKAVAARVAADTSDVLQRVGNFLGSSRNILQDLGFRQVALLQQIAYNTRRTTTDTADFPYT